MSKMWIGLICFVGVVTLYFNGKAGMELWDYFSLQREARAKVDRWEVVPVGFTKYAIKAHYFFEVSGSSYEGETIFRKSDFLNEYSARQSIPKWKEKEWAVWYNIKKPLTNSLQKIFPFKSAVRALLSLAVFLYFFVVKVFLARREEMLNV